jgi:hypothetical protein
MKKLTTSLLVSFLILSSSLCTTAEAIDVMEPPKLKNLFTLKAEKQFVGAQVEIYNASGELITSQSLQKRKMVIDFGDAMLGMYTIKVVKGESQQEFKYFKK